MTRERKATSERRIDWLNEGVFLLISVMSGREINKESAEYAVFEDWRKRGSIIEPGES